jgi:hypothetical protein
MCSILNTILARKETVMKKVTADFTLQGDGVKGVCPAGEAWAEEKRLQKKILCLLVKAPAFGAISPGGQPIWWAKRSLLHELATRKSS